MADIFKNVTLPGQVSNAYAQAVIKQMNDQSRGQTTSTEASVPLNIPIEDLILTLWFGLNGGFGQPKKVEVPPVNPESGPAAVVPGTEGGVPSSIPVPGQKPGLESLPPTRALPELMAPTPAPILPQTPVAQTGAPGTYGGQKSINPMMLMMMMKNPQMLSMLMLMQPEILKQITGQK